MNRTPGLRSWLRVLPLALLLGACGDGAGPLPGDVHVTPRGHYEIELDEQANPLPVFEPKGGRIGLCLEVPGAVDSDRWRARLAFGAPAAAGHSAAPDAELEHAGGRTLCFDRRLPADPAEASRQRLCATVEGPSGAFRVPCQPFIIRSKSADYLALQRRARADAGGVELRRAAADAAAGGYPMLAGFLRLIEVHRLRGSGSAEDLASADELLAADEGLLANPAAAELAGNTDYQRALVALDVERRAEAWSWLGRAERSLRRTASPIRLAVVGRQASLLSSAGAGQEAVLRLREALDQSAGAPASLTSVAEETLAWLLLRTPQADAQDIAAAERKLVTALDLQEDRASKADPPPRETATTWLNVAHLRTRLPGTDVADAVGRARDLLGRAPPEDKRTLDLRDWSRVILGLGELAAGNHRAALTHCSLPPRRSTEPLLAAWADSCRGRSRRGLGATAQALEDFDRALAILGGTPGAAVGQSIHPGPGLRAEVHYRAARAWVDLGDADRAWDLLERLDHVATDETMRRQCLASGRGAGRRHAAEGDALLAELLALGQPTPAVDDVRRTRRRQELRQRLREHQRRFPECQSPGAPRVTATSAQLRAFEVDGEILLLGRDARGQVALQRRTQMAPDRFRRTASQLGLALEEKTLDDEGWRRLARPLAEALVPEGPFVGGSVVSYSLHGLLQQIPLAALPMGDDGWLADRLTVALRPAGALVLTPHTPPQVPTADDPALSTPESGAVFIVDPGRNLPSAPRLLRFYRRLYPDAHVLAGGEATREAFLKSVAGASALHLDGHARYHPAFPELTALELSDGPVTLRQLAAAARPSHFANLSGCHTGRWSVTADSGHYGLGGLLVQLGTRWSVAARARLADDLAAEFNEIFYRSLAAGTAVPTAFQRALADVRSRHPVHRWAGLMLLFSGETIRPSPKRSPGHDSLDSSGNPSPTPHLIHGTDSPEPAVPSRSPTMPEEGATKEVL
ncbi:MAG: CHAT domain-containing protein [Acidobacteriota bacterium]